MPWLVGFVNGFNHMDGIEGVSVAHVTYAGAACIVVGISYGIEPLSIGGAIVAVGR